MSRGRLRVTSRRRVLGVLGAVVLALGAGVVLGSALQKVLAPSPATPSAAPYALVAAEHGEVERSIRLDVAADRPGGANVVSSSDGVLTERLVPQGERVGPGQALYSVDLVPVVVASGEVPAFREMVRGHSGRDVRQLQQLLVDVGVRVTPPDGEFGAATQQQVRTWQEQAGLPVTGTVPLGQVAFVPDLPGLVDWADDVPLGTRLTAGTVPAAVVPDEATFTMTVPEGQLGMIQPGMRVRIEAAGGELRGRIGKLAPVEDGVTGSDAVRARIDPVAGQGSVCAGMCGTIATDGEQVLPAQVVVTPPTAGTTVPVAAVETGASGTTRVTLEDGTSVDVEVDAVDGGHAVVSGLEPGVEVRVLVGDGAGDGVPEG